MSTSEIATVLAWHDAVNDNDVDTLLELSSDDIVLPTDDDDEDQGLDELREWATTAGVTLTPGRMFVHGGIVVVEETATWASEPDKALPRGAGVPGGRRPGRLGLPASDARARPRSDPSRRGGPLRGVTPPGTSNDR